MREVFGRFEQPPPYILPDPSPQHVPKHSEPMQSSDDDVDMTEASSADSDPDWDPENDCYAIPHMDEKEIYLDREMLRRVLRPQSPQPELEEPLIDSSDSEVSSQHSAQSGYLPPTIPSMDKEQVLLDPRIFRLAIKELKFKPSADMFASATHHQLPRYYSKENDPQAVGQNALAFPWQAEFRPYVNPPWSLISTVLRKIHREGVRAMVVTPEWPDW